MSQSENGNPPTAMPSRVLSLSDPTRKDAGANRISLVISYDPSAHEVQVQGPRGLDIVGLVGIIELAKQSVIAGVTRRSK